MADATLSRMKRFTIYDPERVEADQAPTGRNRDTQTGSTRLSSSSPGLMKTEESVGRRWCCRFARADRFFHERGKLSSGCDSPLPEHLQPPCNRMSKPFFHIP